MIRQALIAALLTGCAALDPYHVPAPTLDPNAMTADQADCFSRAVAAGAGTYNHSVVWQTIQKNETERLVYESCMQGKGLDFYGKPLKASPASAPPAQSPS